MDFAEPLDSTLRGIAETPTGASPMVQRIRSEIDFAAKFADLFPDKTHKWQRLILKAAGVVKDRLSASGAIDLTAVISEAELILAPIGEAAKEYTIHCCGHAHIDMNWMWPWQETVSVTHDTFPTVDRLMDEFPEFHFSQSQASTYIGMEEFCPEIFEAIKKRIAEGRWELTASMWVEGDKNLASGEILCRHMLYTRRYFNEKLRPAVRRDQDRLGVRHLRPRAHAPRHPQSRRRHAATTSTARARRSGSSGGRRPTARRCSDTATSAATTARSTRGWRSGWSITSRRPA